MRGRYAGPYSFVPHVRHGAKVGLHESSMHQSDASLFFRVHVRARGTRCRLQIQHRDVGARGRLPP